MARTKTRARTLAPAKLNLHLEILGKRPDGFHELVSLFIMTSLADDLSLEVLRPGKGFSLTGSFSCALEKNLITRAVYAFCDETGVRPDFRIKVKKRIPEGAGLGGGSSDAAAALRILARLFPGRCSDGSLLSIASGIGSDVPFFLGSAQAVVKGRGEKVSPVSARTDFSILLCIPDFSVATRDAYKWLDQARADEIPEQAIHDSEIGSHYLEQKPDAWPFFNSFYQVLKPRFPQYRVLEESISASGGSFCILSGSGSAFVGIFSETRLARNAGKKVDRISGPLKSKNMVISPLPALPDVSTF